jgi:hypothetical protein
MGKSKSDRPSKNKADQDYYVKYRHDHVFVIRDNKDNENNSNMI